MEQRSVVRLATANAYDTAFAWYFSLPAARKRAVGKAIKVLRRAGAFRSVDECLDVLFQAERARY